MYKFLKPIMVVSFSSFICTVLHGPAFSYYLWFLFSGSGLTVSYFSMSLLPMWFIAVLVCLLKFITWCRHYRTNSKSMRRIIHDMSLRAWLWFGFAVACLLPLLPFSFMPIWNIYQFYNFHYMYFELLLMLELIEHSELVKHQWRWSKYFAFDKLGLCVLTIALMRIVDLQFANYTIFGWCMAVLMIQPLKAYASELIFRGWLQPKLLNRLSYDEKPNSSKLLFVLVVQAIIFGLIGSGVLSEQFWSAMQWLTVALMLHEQVSNAEAVHDITYLCYGVVFYMIVLCWPLNFGISTFSSAMLCELVSYSVFGFSMGLIAHLTGGVEYSSFWHALIISFSCISSFGMAFLPDIAINQATWYSCCHICMLLAAIVLLTALVHHWRLPKEQDLVCATEQNAASQTLKSGSVVSVQNVHPAACSTTSLNDLKVNQKGDAYVC